MDACGEQHLPSNSESMLRLTQPVEVGTSVPLRHEEPKDRRQVDRNDSQHSVPQAKIPRPKDPVLTLDEARSALASLSQGDNVPKTRVPTLLHSLSENFPALKLDVISIAENDSAPIQVRAMLMELLSFQWMDPDARQALHRIFETSELSDQVAAIAALQLSDHTTELGADRERIQTRVLKNYAELPADVRPAYLRVLGKLGNSDSVDLAWSRFQESEDPRERLVAIEILGMLAIPDPVELGGRLFDVVARLGVQDQASASARVDQTIAMRAVGSISALGGDANLTRLIDIAAAEELSMNVRMMAVQELGSAAQSDARIAEKLRQIEADVRKSDRPSYEKDNFSLIVQAALR